MNTSPSFFKGEIYKIIKNLRKILDRKPFPTFPYEGKEQRKEIR